MSKKIIIGVIVIAIAVFLIVKFTGKGGENNDTSENRGGIFNSSRDNDGDDENVKIDSIEVSDVNYENNTARVIVRGALSMDCSTVGSPEIESDGNGFDVTIREIVPAGAECSESVRQFSTVVNIDTTDLAAGSYEVEVNDQETSFEYDPANAPAPAPDPVVEVDVTAEAEVTAETETESETDVATDEEEETATQ